MMKEVNLISFQKTLISLGIKRNIPTVIFCDPGVDDALMLLQLLNGQKNYVIKGIIPVRGNASSKICLENTLALCEYIGRYDVAIFPGKQEDFKGIPIYGKHGMGGLKIPVPSKKAHDILGIDFVCDLLKKQKTLIISTAGLTEPAEVLLRLHHTNPAHFKNIAGISLMGGVIHANQEANFPVWGKRISEANVADNPEATKILFDLAKLHHIPIFLSTLDLTHSVLVSRSDIARLRLQKNRLAQCAFSLISNVPLHYRKRFGRGPDQYYRQPLHDVHASSCLLHPALYHGRWVDLEVNERITARHFSIIKENTGNVFLLSLSALDRQKFIDAMVNDFSHFCI